MSPNIYKNGVSVGIPGTNRIGLELAAALGALLDEPERGLAILADVTGDIVQQAAAIVSDGRVHVAYGQTPEPLYVRAIVSGGGEEAQAVIRGDYSCVTEILRNGAPVMQAEGRTHGTAVYPLVEYSVQELYETILSIERESFRFLLEDARRNQEAVRRDLEDPELPLGRLLKQRISGQMTGPLAVSAEAQAYTAAAGEARMSDLSVPQTTLLSGLVGRVLGGFGKVCMGLAVSLTCLTTAIGIGSTGASVINEVSKGRISYKLWMGIACVVGAVFGSFGIQNIINYVTPIFLIMYPICIVLTVLGLVDKWIPNGFSISLFKRYAEGEDTLTLCGYQFIVGGGLLLLTGLCFGGTLLHFTGGSLLLLGYMVLLSAVAQTIWSALTRYNPVGRVAVYGFLNPVFGVLLSALLLREGQQAFTPYSLAALVLVCVGIFVVNRSDAPGRGAQANQQP